MSSLHFSFCSITYILVKLFNFRDTIILHNDKYNNTKTPPFTSFLFLGWLIVIYTSNLFYTPAVVRPFS